MQLIPEGSNSRTTAILLFLVSVILVYLLCFHWFFLKHRDFATELSDLRQQLGRFEAVAQMRESVDQQLSEIRASRDDASLFLAESDFNEAAAAMSERLGQMVTTMAETDCQIVSRQPVRSRVEERFQRVTVNVRMRCQSPDLLQILYQLESEVPMIIVDELNITKPRARRRVGNTIVQSSESLDIRFNMTGYLR